MRLFSTFLLCLSFSRLAPAADVGPRAETPAGIYRGQEVRGARLFANIAYAKPPLGARRWRQAEPEDKVRQRAERVACPQVQNDGLTTEALPAQEDCLYLNVWAPLAPAHAPVVLFIHGGGLLGGSGLKTIYDGSLFARNGVVFVSFNYRLGEMGYGPKLDPRPGSLGLMDQALVLQWVKANVAAFGGDPRRIYLMGHSKGAEAVSALMYSGLAGPEVRGGLALSVPRHFDVGFNRWLPADQGVFSPGEAQQPWEKVLRAKKVKLYVPELPRLRLPGEAPHRFRLLVSTLYDERFGGRESTIYCDQADFFRQAFDYIDPYFYVLHPHRFEHGDEVLSLFDQDRFGRALLRLVIDFVHEREPPGANGMNFRKDPRIIHFFPSFTWRQSYEPHDFGPGFCQERRQLTPVLRALETFSAWLERARGN